MADLTVWMFDAPNDAEAAALVLEGLADQGSIVLHDVAAVSWLQGRRGPSTRRFPGSEQNPLDEFLIETAEAELTEGHSALLVRSSHREFEEIRRSFRWTRAHLVVSDVDSITAAELREVLRP